MQKIPINLYDKFGALINVNRLGEKVHKLANLMKLENWEEIHDYLLAYWPNGQLTEIYKPNNNSFKSGLSTVGNMMLIDQQKYLPYDNLVKMDRASMHSSLETRAPFLDHNIVSFIWSTPDKWRLENKKGKKILREILYKYVPCNLVDRPKQGFGVPVNHWLKGPLKEWAEDLLSKSNLPDDGLINGKIVRKIWFEHQNNKFDWNLRIWPILIWQMWSQQKGINT